MADDKKPNAITRYFRETAGELRKVTWPTWPEARQLTLIVVGVMVATGIFLALIDLLGEQLIKFALGA